LVQEVLPTEKANLVRGLRFKTHY